jgi:hypothetical protein
MVKARMAKDEKLGETVKVYCLETAYELNRNYIVTVLIKQAIDRQHGALTKRKRTKLKVVFPSHRGGVTETKTDKAFIAKLLQRSLDFDIYKHSLVAAVSAIEDALSNILRTVLQRFPERLNATAGGEKVDKTVKLSMILESPDLEELRRRLVERRVLQILYESPHDYQEIFRTITGFKISEAVRSTYVEIKATRDVVIHNKGIINNTYLEKVGASARGKLGDEITLTSTYFADSITNLKKLLAAILAENSRVFGVPASK